MTEDYADRQVVGMDLHRRRSVLVRMTEDGWKLEDRQDHRQPGRAARRLARGENPRVVLEATCGWY